MKIKGLGEFRVLILRETPPREPGQGPDEIYNYWRDHIRTEPRFNPDVETFWCVAVNTRRVITGCYLVCTGTLDTCYADPREVFAPAIVAKAAAIVMIHNHPSGDPSPSEADIKVTRDMIRAGQIIKIEVLDHVIMGEASEGQTRTHCSLRELGYFYN